jgi:hypothetical protein
MPPKPPVVHGRARADALAYGPTAPQTVGAVRRPGASAHGRDFRRKVKTVLVLNVFTPALSGRPQAGR